MRCFIERRGQGLPLVFVHGWGLVLREFFDANKLSGRLSAR